MDGVLLIQKGGGALPPGRGEEAAGFPPSLYHTVLLHRVRVRYCTWPHSLRVIKIRLPPVMSPPPLPHCTTLYCAG